MKHVRLTLFAIISLLSFFGGFFLFDAKTSIRLYIAVAYPATVILFLLVFYSLYRSDGFNLSKLKRLGSPKLLPLSLLFCLLGFMFVRQEPFGFKTLADEALIVSTSQNLHLERKPLFIWRAYDIDSNFTPVEQYLDKRPIAFSTLLSFVHDLIGFRVENAYFLNTLLGLGVLAFVGYWGYYILGRLGAALGMLLMAGLPLLSVYSHGGGFDVFHIFMIFVVIGCGLRWYDRSDDWSLVAFVLTGVLLCFTRYEAALFAFPIGIVVVWKWIVDRRIQLPWILLVVPLLMVLIPLHQKVFELNENYWELDFRPEADAIFGFKYFYPNLASAIRFLWDTSDVFPNSPFLSSLGVLSSVLLVGTGIPRIRHTLSANPKAVVWITFLGMIVIHFLLMMVYFYGQFDYGPLHRFALPICVFFVMCSLWGLRLFEQLMVRRLILGIVCIGYFFYSIPVASKHHYSNNNWTSLHSIWVGKYAVAHRDESFMVIGFNPVYWTLEGIPSIPWGQANLNPEKLKFQLEHKGFEKILIVERIVRDEVTGDLGNADKVQLVDGFKKEVVEEFVFDSFFRIRVSQLLDVDVKAVEANVAALTNSDLLKENPGEKFRRMKPISLSDKPGMAEFYFNLP